MNLNLIFLVFLPCSVCVQYPKLVVSYTFSGFFVLSGGRVSLRLMILTRTKALRLHSHGCFGSSDGLQGLFLVWSLSNSPALSQDLCYQHNYHLTHTCTQTSTYILMFQTMNDFQFFKDASAPPRHPTLGCTPYRHHLHHSYYISRLLLVFLNQFKYHFPGTSVTCSHGSLCFPQSQTL